MRAERNIVAEEYEDRYKHRCFAKVIYYINEKKKIIVCKIHPWCIPSEDLFEYDGLNYTESLNKSFYEMCMECGISFIGKATCMEVDRFDAEIGKKIAYDKAMVKLLNEKKKYILEDIKELEEYMRLDYELAENIDKQIDKVKERFDRKIKEIISL
jgi:hypothetical protein